jgi:hypothetical protein
MQRVLKLLVSLLFASIALPVSRAADNNQPSSIVPAGAPKSEFLDDPGNGKDPFFPKSTRRKVVVRTPDAAPPDPTVPDFVRLQGISFSAGRKLAIINNYTLGEGEEFTFKVNGQPIKIQCIEIKEKSVIVAVSGATKEIPLRAGLQ